MPTVYLVSGINTKDGEKYKESILIDIANSSEGIDCAMVCDECPLDPECSDVDGNIKSAAILKFFPEFAENNPEYFI